ncbi:GRIP and coiled-coil domain-containing protein 2 [Erpetoichthys calabaricus]|uniref:GRIP and coiled-coil domain containing 2 n=1 Tax=Erpetoichthys calabaricus TaxID=27687 RepID=A0A8C4SMR9_ERPCA|nr:GRIP and coiled-coil domain-containing protein 2 [Erpetoichthys calabaricus]
MEDQNQDSPGFSTPGTVKSKLDALSKEDLVKFTKKQMAVLQKVKSKCAELEKEVQELKDKTQAGTEEAIIQELTERMDAVLLEKAESQQRLAVLRKESEKAKKEAQEAQEKLSEMQQQLDLSREDQQKQIEVLKNDLESLKLKHTEEVADFQRLVQESHEKQEKLTNELELRNSHESEISVLEKQVKMDQEHYLEQINNLKQQLSFFEKEKDVVLKESQRTVMEELKKEVEVLHGELLNMKVAHDDELKELRDQLDTAATEYEEERERLLRLIEDQQQQLIEKEKNLHDVKEEEEEEEETKRDLEKCQSEGFVCEKQDDEMSKLKMSVNGLQSQLSILQDELTYLSNLKLSLEMELRHTKDEFLHEREELEFKVNELQLYKEDAEGNVAKCKAELQATHDSWEVALNQHQVELQALQEQHQKEIASMEKTLLSSNEKEKAQLLAEIKELKTQCEALSYEKREAVSSYEKTQEILQNLQLELSVTTENVAKQFNALKERGASEIHELQQKLRVAYNEKDSLLETIKKLECEVEAACQNATEEFKLSLSKCKEANTELTSQLQHKDINIQEIKVEMEALLLEKENITVTLKNSEIEVERLKELLHKEQIQSGEVQQKVEDLKEDLEKLKLGIEDKENQLKHVTVENDSLCRQLECMESKLQDSSMEKEKHLLVFKEEMIHLQEELRVSQEENLNLIQCKENSEDRERSLQLVLQEKDILKKNVEEKLHQLSEVRVQALKFWQQDPCLQKIDCNEEIEEDASLLIQSLLSKISDENQRVILQTDEQIAQLQNAIERQKEENRLQFSEHQSFIEDLSKERTLLKENLEEVIADKEGLQRDLIEMQNRNEKTRAENEALLVQIGELSEKMKVAECIIEKEQKVTSGYVEKDLQNTLAEKEKEILSLQQEISALKEAEQNYLVPQDSNDKELKEKLEKELLDKDEKMNKIKAVAVKAKKELDASRKEVQALKEDLESVKSNRDRLSCSMKDVIQSAESYKNLVAEYDKLTEQLDLEKQRANNCERQVGEVKSLLQAAVLQENQLRSENEDFAARSETLQHNVKQLEVQIMDIQKAKLFLEKELEGERLLKEQTVKDHSTVLKEVEDLQSQLQKQKQQFSQTTQELEQLRKGAQQSTLMDIEIANYDRLVKELNQKISVKEKQIEEDMEEINMYKQKQENLHEEITSLKSLLEQAEDKNTKIKQLLVKTKKELSDSKKCEADQLIVHAGLKGELEACQQQLEDLKLQCADLTADKHKLQEQLRTMAEQHHRATNAFQQKITALQEECNTAKEEQASTAAEFENYKVRVHNVLKQQKNKSSSQSENDVSKQEREYLEKVMEQLKAKLQETQKSLKLNTDDLQTLQMEHDTLLERHNKMLQETVAKEAELRERVCTVQSENAVLKSEHNLMLSQLTAQNESQRNTFRDQMRHLQEDHRKTVETLQQQVNKLEAQLFHLQKEATAASPPPGQQLKKSLQERKYTDQTVCDLQSMAREEGEGMETTETESGSLMITSTPSLEQLLNSPEPKTEPSLWQAEPSKEQLTQKLNSATKNIDHLNGLLRESEATNAILMEQITLLKNEVRRLERNQEREKSVANLEYLKNVLLQFIFLKSSSERQALLPVIHTMLQLSPEEKSKLSAIAQGEDEAASTSRSSGWTSYLHSWSGIR